MSEPAQIFFDGFGPPPPKEYAKGGGACTGERILARRPELPGMVRALFFNGFGIREISRRLSLSTHSVEALLSKEIDKLSADEWRQVQCGGLRNVAMRATAAATRLLSHERQVQAAGIKGIATLIKDTVHAHELLSGKLPGQTTAKPIAAADFIDSDGLDAEPVDQMDSPRLAPADSTDEPDAGADADDETITDAPVRDADELKMNGTHLVIRDSASISGDSCDESCACVCDELHPAPADEPPCASDADAHGRPDTTTDARGRSHGGGGGAPRV